MGQPQYRSSEDPAGDSVHTWSDAQLVAAVAAESPDPAALDVLVERHWKFLYGRCRMLTLDADSARDLAQESWVRVLQARRSLRPGFNFAGYLVTIARNIWYDQHRAARRAGPLSLERMSRLDDASPGLSGESIRLADAVPDLASLSKEDDDVLRFDIDRALARLAPQARALLIARFLDGESAAEIGVRYGRTEQTITAWLRTAIQDIRQYFDETHSTQIQETFNAP